MLVVIIIIIGALLPLLFVLGSSGAVHHDNVVMACGCWLVVGRVRSPHELVWRTQVGWTRTVDACTLHKVFFINGSPLKEDSAFMQRLVCAGAESSK